MRNFSPAVVFFFFLAPARAATLPSDSSTLEALRAVQANGDGSHFFDGVRARVQSIEPVAYQPLPPVTTPREEDRAFTKTTVLAPNLTVHSAPEPKPLASSRASGGVPRAVSGSIAGVGVGLIVAGLLVGGPALAPLAAAGALMALVGAVLWLTAKKN